MSAPPDAMAVWQQRYDDAGRRMTSGDYAGAVQLYTELATTAPTDAARSLALDQLRLATEYQRRQAGGPPPPAVTREGVEVTPSPAELPPPAPHADRTRRSADELVLLYVGGVMHGMMTGFFVDSLTQTDKPTGGATIAALPLGLGFVGADVAAIALVDSAHLLHYGMPQSIFAGAFIGAGEGVAWGEWAGNRATTSFHTYSKDMAYVWGFTTGGAIAGAITGALVPVTPGRATWVSDVSFATGLFAAGIAGGVSGDASFRNGLNTSREGNRNVGLSAAIAGLGGLGAGILTAGPLSPSRGRAHIIEAGWIGGSLFAGGICAAYKCGPSGVFGAIAVGDAVGFLGTFLATWGMKPDPLSDHAPDAGVSLIPMVSPTDGGLQIGVGGTL